MSGSECDLFCREIGVALLELMYAGAYFKVRCDETAAAVVAVHPVEEEEEEQEREQEEEEEQRSGVCELPGNDQRQGKGSAFSKPELNIGSKSRQEKHGVQWPSQTGCSHDNYQTGFQQ